NGDLLSHQVRTTAEGGCPGRCMPVGIVFLSSCEWYARRIGVRCDRWSLLTPAKSLLRLLRQAVNIGGQQVHLVVAKDSFLSRHAAVTTIAKGLLDLGETGTVQPDVVGQVRRTHGSDALGIR